jgi:uncharacterized protein YqeY
VELRDRLRTALRVAMRARDGAAVAALRSAIAAVDNAGAVTAQAPPTGAPSAPSATCADVAGALAGLGAGEVPRRELTEPEVADLIRAEVTDRLAAAGDYQRSGRAERADRLRREAAALTAVLDEPSGPAAGGREQVTPGP